MANLVESMEEQAGGSCAGSIPLNTLQDNISEEALNAALADGGLGGAGSAPAMSSSTSATQKRLRGGAVNDGIGVVCSGQSSPGRSSHSLSNSSARTATSNGSLPRRSFSRECYNSSPEPDEESNQEDDLEQLIRLHAEDFARPSIGVQTDYDDNFPPLKFLRSIVDDNNQLAAMPPMMFNMSDHQQQLQHHMQQQQSPMVSIVPSSTSSSDLAASATCSSNSADGTLQLVIQNFRHMADTVRGPSKFVQSVPWRIMVMPRQHVVAKKGTQKCLGFFLQCCPDAYSESWSCQAAAELRLISQKPGVPNFTRKTNHVYTAKENDWGYSCFMTWADILDEAQGYIKDDKVVLEVSVKADPPKNILSHKEFQKKIQEYKRLADMQCQRGLIDKAIEVNAQALKFCKDKDTECKTQLETQKAHLIEMKLKQSIERIEKGNDPNKPSEDDSAANLNALRHALGTNAARAASVKNTTTQKSNNKTVSKEANETLTKMPADTTTPPMIPVTDDRSTTPPAHLEHTLQNGVLPSFETKQKSAILGSNMVQKKSSKSTMGCSAGDQCKGYLNNKGHLNSKELVALGHFNKSLLNSDEFDFVKERYEDEEELLPQQIQHYLQHLSEKDKESSRLKRFSAELEMLASPLETGKRADDAYFNELLSLPPREADALTLAALNCEMEEQKMNPKNRKLYRKNLCDSCLKEERDVKNSAERVPPPTSESGCQTEFSRCLSREVLATDAAARLMQLQQHQQQQQQLQQANELVNNIAPPALPARQRKKATAKKTMQQQQQQQLMQQQQQQHPKANPRNARMNASLTGMQENMLPTMGLLNAMDKKPLMGANLDNNLANLAAELEIGKMQNEEMMAAQPTANSIFSRQYIEEWLRYSARNVLKLNYDNNGKPFITTRSGNDVAEICSENNLREPEISEVSTALGVIGLNCMNARNIQQKVADFVETLESHTNFREMRASIDRLLSLCSDDENFTGADDSISVVSVSESSTKDTDMSKDFADFASFPRTFAEEDPHDYMLSRELKQAEIALATRLTNIIFQLHQASLPDIVDRLAMKMESIKAHDVQVNKQCSDAHKSLQVANEKYEKLNQQLKDRKNEIKKLEKKAKSEAQLAAENSELHDKLDAFKKEVSHLQRQINEEQMKYKRDTQSLADSKKHLHVEMTSRATEIQKLSNQLEEKTQALKKSESQLANERKSNSSIISSLTERVKKAEMSLLEHKLEDGLKILERARDDCVMQIRSLEEQQKRHVFPAEQEVIRKNIAEWETKKEEVIGLISQAKADFSTHINSIKGGKQLSQLPKLQVPRPPPCPKLYPMPVPPPAVVPPPVVMPPPVSSTAARVASPITNNIAGPAAAAVVVPPSPLPLERKAITPPSSNRSRMGGATTPQHQIAGMGMSSNSIQSPGGSGVVTYPSSSIPNSSNATPVKNFQLHQQPPPSLPTASNVNPIAPIGVRPYNYQNGVSQQPKAPTPMMHLHQARHSPTASLGSQYANMMQQQQQQQMPVQMQQQQYLQQQQQQQQQMQQKSQAQQQQQAVGGAYQSWVGWGDQVNNISELFCQGRSFGPLGSDFGNSAARSNGGSAGGNGNPNINNSNSNNNNGGGFFS